MKLLKIHKSIVVFTLLLALILGVGVFADPSTHASAEATYTVTFKKSGKNEDNILKTITVNEGESVKESELPLDKLLALENGTYIWFYSTDDNSLTKLSVKGDQNNEILITIIKIKCKYFFYKNIIFFAIYKKAATYNATAP